MTRDEDENRALAAIGSTEPSSFNEFLRAYPDTPEKGDTGAWSELFGLLEWLEHQKLIVIERVNRRIESLQLTSEGVDRVRGLKDRDRELFEQL